MDRYVDGRCSQMKRCVWMKNVEINDAKHTDYLWDEVHASLPLLFLKLKRNTSYWSSLDTLHQMSHEASNLVPHTLRRDDGDFVANTLVRVEVHSQARVVLLDDGPCRFLHGLRANSLHV